MSQVIASKVNDIQQRNQTETRVLIECHRKISHAITLELIVLDDNWCADVRTRRCWRHCAMTSLAEKVARGGCGDDRMVEFCAEV